MKKADAIVIFALFLISIILFFCCFNSNSGTTAEIYINNKKIETLYLNKNIEKTYNTNYGSNTVVIFNNQVFVKTATCRDEVCVKSGKKHTKGDVIVCSPHRFLVEVH